MRRWLAWFAIAGTGCAGGKHAQKKPEAGDPYADALRNGPPAGYQPGQGPGDSKHDGPRGFKVEHDVGVLDQYQVEDAIATRWPQITRCYDRAGDAQRYAAGTVRMRFIVNAHGGVDDVLVLESPLGNFEVERCVVDEAKQVRMPRPGGGVRTTFDYRVQFKSSREIDVIDWPADRLEKDLAVLAPQLGECGKLGAAAVLATFYILPRGRSVGSVGLSSEQAIDTAAGVCVVDKIRGWKPPTVPSAAATRITMAVPEPGTAPAPSDDPPARKSRGKTGNARTAHGHP